MAAHAEEVERESGAVAGPRRVIFVNRYFHPDESATSQLLSDLAFHLAGEGMAVHVVAGRQRYDDPRARLPARERIGGVGVHRVWSTRFGRAHLATRAIDYLSFYAGVTAALLRLVRPGDVLVAKTDPPLVSVPAAAVARVKGAVMVNWVQDLFPEVATAYGIRAARGALGALIRRARDWSYREAGGNVALCESMARRLRRAGMRGVRVIPNWSDGGAITPLAARDNPLRSAWDLADRFVVGYSGNLGRAHDAGTILGAAQALAGEPGVRFLMIGGGVERDRLAERCRALELDNVVFRAFQPRERLRESLGVADVHLVSLRADMEGLVFPSKLYGVLAAGRPVIFIGDTEGEIARLLREEGCGVAVAQNDAEALAQAVRALAADPARCAEMGRRARALFEARYERRIALQSWAELIAAVAAAGAEVR